MPQQGRIRLAEYGHRMRLLQRDLAQLLDMHESTLSHILSGRRRPGLATALRIEAATGIPVYAWSDSGRGNSQSAARTGRKTGNLGRVKTRVA